MTFDEAEARFRELQARVQRGESISRAEYEDQVSQLAVQDDRGVLWEINPRTGKWMYFDGAEWVGGTPPGRDHSTVMPAPRPTPPPPSVPVSPPVAPPSFSAPPPSRPIPTPPARPVPPATSPQPFTPMPARPISSGARPITPPAPVPAAPAPAPADTVPPYVRVAPEQGAGANTPGGTPTGGQIGPRILHQGPLGGPNREWVPLAIGAAVLFLCAVLLFFGGRAVLAVLGPTPATPTVRAVVAPLPTNTPMPTAVRLPTQPVPTAAAQPILAKVIETSVNVRSGPNTSAKVLSKLKKGDQISLVARNDAGDWYQIKISGSTAPGWVFGETLQIVSGDPKLLPVAGAVAPAPTKGAVAPAPQVSVTPTVIGARPPGQ